MNKKKIKTKLRQQFFVYFGNILNFDLMETNTHGYFSKPDLGGIDPGDFLDSLRESNEKFKQKTLTNLFQKINITLHSGEESDFKIECDALTDEDLECLAYLVSRKIKFHSVRGVPEGGLRFAKALEKYCEKESGWEHPGTMPPIGLLIVDDVFTTGKSMEFEKQVMDWPELQTIKGIVIFARGKCPDWITPIFQLNL